MRLAYFLGEVFMSGYAGSTTKDEDKDCWRTPEFIIEWVSDLLCGLDFDTACTIDNAVANPVWIGSGNNDALLVDWHGRCWCNPPYSAIGPWIDKAIASRATTAMLIPTPNGEKHYSRLSYNAHEISIIWRLSFIGADGLPKSGNNRGSSLFIINGYGQGSRSFVDRDELIARYRKGGW